jgi:Tfp pilus tip-associated adhesin PilY1
MITSSPRQYILFAIGIAVLLAAFGLLWLRAAPLAQPESQPLNYVAAPTLSTYYVGGGGAVAYGVWFENGTWQGDLIAQAVDTYGQVSATALWKARSVFADPAGANANDIASTYWNTTRVVVSTDGGTAAGWSGNRPGASNRIKFRYNDGTAIAGSALTMPQQTLLGPNPTEQEKIVKFVRGYRGDERISATQAAMRDRNLPQNPSGTLRERYSILGDIIHSNPVYVGTKPIFDYNFSGYQTFKSTTTRAARVYVGANDGMLHAFDASTGREVFAYVPSMLIPKLPKLAKLPYTHTYFVDGELAAGDAYGDFDTCSTKPCWRTVLVGGLGAGGKGFFALDVTTTQASEDEDSARARILWEIGAPSRPSDGDLGYTFSRPTITRLASGKWIVVAGNGYDSDNGLAVLYLIELDTGKVHKVPVPDNKTPTASDKNGLSSPLVVVDQYYNAKYVYAGDLDGNLWRFDLGSQTSGAIDTSAISVQRLFKGSPDQPITAAPDFAEHPQGGFIVVFGTGRAFSDAELSDQSKTQYIIGVYDNGTVSPWTATLTDLASIS